MASDAHVAMLLGLIDDAIQSRMTDVHTAMPGIVEAYDATTQKAEIQPCLMRTYAGEKTSVPLPKIFNVPVVMPRSKSAFISFPLKKGDYVTVLFSERSLDTWLSKGGVVDPEDPAMHALSDAIAIPGCYPFTEPFPGSAEDLLIFHDKSKTTIKADGTYSFQNDNITNTTAADGTVSTTNGKVKTSQLPDGKFSVENDNAKVNVDANGDITITVGTTVTASIKADGNFLFKNSSGDFALKNNGEFSAKNPQGGFSLLSTGKFKIFNASGDDVLAILSDFLATINTAVVATATGPQKLMPVGAITWSTLKTKVDNLKG